MEINDEIGTTIMAFLNLLTADLGIEELVSIEEASNLVDILINLVNTGHLHFTNNGGTFAKATEFVKDKLGSAFIQQILPESADRTDQQEKIMVLLGLIYTLRLAHGPLFLELSDRLDVHNNKWIAMLIAQLDNQERWTPISGPPPASGTPARSDSQSPSGNKENITASNYHLNDTPPNHSSPSRTATSSTGNRSSPFVIRRTPTTMKKQRYRLNFDSPVEKVLNSPRGGEVEQIYSLREEVKSLRELRDKLGREKDEQDELCKQKDEQIILLRQQIGRLDSKISRILPQAERSSTLDERILKLEEQNNNLEKECRAQKNNFAASEGNLSIVRFERDEALQKVDLLEDNLKHLKGEYEKALTRSQDEMAMHERTRKKLTDIEFQTGTELNAMSARLREMESTVEEEKQVCRAQVEQKQRQMEEQLQMINQIREHSEEPERQMRIELEETRQTLNELYGICDAQRARITELEKSKTVVRELEQQIRELKEKQSQLTRSHAMNLKKMQKDLERKEAELDSIKSIKNNLELELDQMRNSVGQQEESDRKVAELEADNLQLIQENVRLQKNQSALIDQHTKEINSLQQALKAKDSKNNNCMTPQRTSSSSLSSAMKNPNLTPSMRVVFTPYRSKMESKISASVEELSTANGGGDSTLLGTTTTASQEDSGNQDDRLKELRERNRRYQPHMRSNYLPEVAHLKSSNPELNKIY